MSTYVSGTFFNDDRANDAIEELAGLGYPREQIHVVMSPETRGRFAKGNAPGASQSAKVATGPLAAALAGGGAEMPEEGAKKVAHDIEAGGIVVGVRARDEDVAEVRTILADVDELDTSGELVNPARVEERY
jgi:hypothetical protein